MMSEAQKMTCDLGASEATWLSEDFWVILSPEVLLKGQ